MQIVTQLNYINSVWEIVKSSIDFYINNLETYLKTIIPYLPFIFTLFVCDSYLRSLEIHYFHHKYPQGTSTKDLADMIYLLPKWFFILVNLGIQAVLAISWHRVVILGWRPQSNFNVSIFKLNADELDYIKIVFLTFCGPIIFVPLLFLLFFLGVPEIVIYHASFISIFLWYLLSLKIFPYFPAKAIGKSTSLIGAFKSSNGFTGKFISSFLLMYISFILGTVFIVYFWQLFINFFIDTGFPEHFGVYEFFVLCISKYFPRFLVSWFVILPLTITLVSKIFIEIMKRTDAKV